MADNAARLKRAIAVASLGSDIEVSQAVCGSQCRSSAALRNSTMGQSNVPLTLTKGDIPVAVAWHWMKCYDAPSL